MNYGNQRYNFYEKISLAWKHIFFFIGFRFLQRRALIHNCALRCHMKSKHMTAHALIFQIWRSVVFFVQKVDDHRVLDHANIHHTKDRNTLVYIYHLWVAFKLMNYFFHHASASSACKLISSPGSIWLMTVKSSLSE